MRRRSAAEQADEEGEVESSSTPWRRRDPSPPTDRAACGKGHPWSLMAETPEGGGICLLCFSNLLSDPSSPSHHVSYALSQISASLPSTSSSSHRHLLVFPLVQALSSLDDDAIALQLFRIISDLSSCPSLARDFTTRIVDQLLLGTFAWSRRRIHMLHCLGTLLLDRPDVSGCIRDPSPLVSNLVRGLELPSEEIRGEILFVLYRLFLLLDTPWDANDDDDNDDDRAKLLWLTLETLLKTQSDDVRLNCIALLMVLAQKGQFFAPSSISSNSTSRQQVNSEENGLMFVRPLVNLFSDAIKGPLLSSDPQVQIAALNLIFYSLHSDITHSNILNEESVTDYIFEILRLSENNDALVTACIRTLDLLAMTEQSFKPRLEIGFPILLSSLHYVAEIPLHPVQSHALRLVRTCVVNSPGVISISQLEDLALMLSKLLRLQNHGELGMVYETFGLACMTFVEVLHSPSSLQLPKIATLAQQASRDAVLSIISQPKNTDSLLHALYLLKEVYQYCDDKSLFVDKQDQEVDSDLLEVCESHLLPWFKSIVDLQLSEDDVLGVLETFNFILVQGSDLHFRRFARTLACSSWLTLSFVLLGLFPTDRMRYRVYLMLSSVVDGVLGEDSGQPIRDANLDLPLDPLDLMFTLGQKTTLDASSLNSIQSAVILILYMCSLLDERLADGNQILASLEQYILVNASNFSRGLTSSVVLTHLIHLYGFVRGSQMASCSATYSAESEKILLQLIGENDWDLLSMGIHPVSLKWLFQQERILPILSIHILNFCRCYSRKEIQVAKTHGFHAVDIQIIAELAICEDSYFSCLLVSLLRKTLEEHDNDDVDSVINVIEAILVIFPAASNQFCTNGIDVAIHSLYRSCSSIELFRKCLMLVFNILYSVRAENLHDGEFWVSITLKLLEIFVPSLTTESCTSQETCLVLGIFSLILQHSVNDVLIEASRSILLNSSLISAMDIVVQELCSKGPALTELHHTQVGELLIFVLLLHLSSLRSVDPESLGWQDFLEPRKGAHQSLVFCICCHDICRLMHFGFPFIKLIASQCLVELLIQLSHHRLRVPEVLRCSVKYLQSIIAVTEGLIYSEDFKVATNCALCLSIILGWQNLGAHEKQAINDYKWCRLIAEELSLALAAPGLASKLFTNKHKPATQITIALLKLNHMPRWLSLVFSGSCISGIISKLSAKNLSAEIVELFRELLARQFLNKEHISALLHIIQACRKHIYNKSSMENPAKEKLEIEKELSTTMSIETGRICRLLIQRMLSSTTDCDQLRPKQKGLLEEIDSFIKETTENFSD